EMARDLDVAGRVWLNEFVQNAAGVQSTDIGFSDLSCSLPIEDLTSNAPARAPAGSASRPRRYFHVEHAAGRLKIASTSGRLITPQGGLHGDMELELQGDLASGRVSATVAARDVQIAQSGVAQGDHPSAPQFTVAGYEARVQLRDFELPARNRDAAFLDSPAL